jgi:hypothetical protein
MMDKEQASKRNGVKYHVELGGLFCVTKTHEEAVKIKKMREAEIANDPSAPSDLKVLIVEA